MVKQIQKGMMSCQCKIVSFFVDFIFETNQYICLCFSDDGNNDEFIFGDGVLFAWKMWKNRLEHAYTVTAWALSLLPDMRAD